MELGSAKADNAIADCVIPPSTGDFPRIEASASEWADVFRPVSEEINALRGNCNTFPSVPLDDARNSLGNILLNHI